MRIKNIETPSRKGTKKQLGPAYKDGGREKSGSESETPAISPSAIEIDAELQELIPRPTEAELALLRESLERDGLLAPLIVWRHNGQVTLIDGHNRLTLIEQLNAERQDHEPIRVVTKEVAFDSRADVIEFIVSNQFGRRNIGPEAASILRAKWYQAKKQDRTLNLKQNRRDAGSPKSKEWTSADAADFVARLSKVSRATIFNDVKFAIAAEKRGIIGDILAGKIPNARKLIRKETKGAKAPAKKKELSQEEQFENLPQEEQFEKGWEEFTRLIAAASMQELRAWMISTGKIDIPSETEERGAGCPASTPDAPAPEANSSDESKAAGGLAVEAASASDTNLAATFSKECSGVIAEECDELDDETGETSVDLTDTANPAPPPSRAGADVAEPDYQSTIRGCHADLGALQSRLAKAQKDGRKVNCSHVREIERCRERLTCLIQMPVDQGGL